jgi:hypothetical protein
MTKAELEKQGWSNDEAVNLYVKVLADQLANVNEHVIELLEQVDRDYDIIPEL